MRSAKSHSRRNTGRPVERVCWELRLICPKVDKTSVAFITCRYMFTALSIPSKTATFSGKYISISSIQVNPHSVRIFSDSCLRDNFSTYITKFKTVWDIVILDFRDMSAFVQIFSLFRRFPVITFWQVKFNVVHRHIRHIISDSVGKDLFLRLALIWASSCSLVLHNGKSRRQAW